MKTKGYRWFNTFAFLGMVIINYVADIIPLGLGTTAEISAKYPSLFTPPGISFIIWGIIYILLMIFVVAQWGSSEEMLSKIGPLFITSCLINSAWIIAWHFDEILISEALIIALLVNLLMIQQKISQLKNRSFGSVIAKLGFDLYAGWIIAASIASTAVCLVKLNWNRFGISEEIMTCIVLVAGALIGMLPTIVKRRFFSTFAVVWAYGGIAFNHLSKNGYSGEYPLVVFFAIAGIVMMIFSVMYVYSEIRHERLFNKESLSAGL